MFLGTPVTWLIVEILALALFIICVIDASKQEHGIVKILELFGFLIYSGIYENIGVAGQIYNYDLHRVMMIGKVPLEILMLEAVIFYVALRLSGYLHIPAWGKPFVVGFLCSIQDMTVDPSAVFDRHLFNGVMSSQWNWAQHYGGTFFGIPFFNFSGWMYMMVYYVITIEIGMWWYQKTRNELISYLYPFIAPIVSMILMLSPITRFSLWAMPFFPMHTLSVEIVMLTLNFALGLFILLKFQKIDRSIKWKTDGVFFLIPIALHLYDIVIAFALEIQIAYVPAIVVSMVHIGYISYIYLEGKKLEGRKVEKKVAIQTT